LTELLSDFIPAVHCWSRSWEHVLRVAGGSGGGLPG